MGFNKKSFENLLSTRICDLNVSVEETPIAVHVRRLYRELKAAGLEHLKPPVYFGDEWFTPNKEVAIAVPFYLATPRLKALEKKTMGRVEGGTREWCMRLLRHEAGHCFDHGYRIPRNAQWRELFGSSAKRYDPDSYAFEPGSKDFVHNLEDNYAQAHPDEDFAETFAVLIDPKVNWKKEYRHWPRALAKLEYVESLIDLYGANPLLTRRRRSSIGDASRLRSPLRRYYRRRLKAAD